LETFRRRFDDGDNAALLLAIELCAFFRIPPPDWAADNFSARFWDWFTYRVPMLDRAFGVVRKHKHPRTQRERKALRPRVVFDVVRLIAQKPSVPIKKIFAEVGARFGRGGGWVEQIFYEPASRSWRKLAKALGNALIVEIP
jgi:hypothetical protein